MTTTQTVVLICDDPRHYTDAEALHTRAITIDGVDYELELCRMHDDEYTAALTPFLSNARVVRHAAAATATGRRPKRSQADRQRSAVIRAWWRNNPNAVRGVTYSDRGRISAAVTSAYASRS